MFCYCGIYKNCLAIAMFIPTRNLFLSQVLLIFLYVTQYLHGNYKCYCQRYHPFYENYCYYCDNCCYCLSITTTITITTDNTTSIHSFIHSFIRSFIHSFIHSFLHSFIHSFISFIHSFIHFISFHFIPFHFISFHFIHSFIPCIHPLARHSRP